VLRGVGDSNGSSRGVADLCDRGIVTLRRDLLARCFTGSEEQDGYL
jgi:hypothetical protein